MILHDLSAGMHPRRVRILIAEKGLSIERREVDAAAGANAMPDFLRLNPLGKLPVLELDDGSATQSHWRFAVIWERCTHCRL